MARLELFMLFIFLLAPNFTDFNFFFETYRLTHFHRKRNGNVASRTDGSAPASS